MPWRRRREPPVWAVLAVLAVPLLVAVVATVFFMGKI